MNWNNYERLAPAQWGGSQLQELHVSHPRSLIVKPFPQRLRIHWRVVITDTPTCDLSSPFQTSYSDFLLLDGGL